MRMLGTGGSGVRVLGWNAQHSTLERVQLRELHHRRPHRVSRSGGFQPCPILEPGFVAAATLTCDLATGFGARRYANTQLSVPKTVQIAIQNGGGIRAPIAEGDITFGDLGAVHPFGNVVSVVEVSGATLWGILENGVDSVPGNGKFPQVGGMSYIYDSSKTSAPRVLAVYLADGSNIANDESETYVIATNNFLLAGGDGYQFNRDTTGCASRYLTRMDGLCATPNVS